MPTILIVEDDVDMAAAVSDGLRAEGYRTVVVGDGVSALVEASEHEFQLAIVDLNLPAMSGFEICRRIRERESEIALLILTARDSIADRVAGLDAGADDYLTKPFSLAELAARVRAQLRRHPAELWARNEFGDLVLDSRSRRATVDGRAVALSPKEFELLRTLISRADSAWPSAELLESVWGTGNISPNVVQQYISSLRRKLAAFESSVEIVTRRNTGYQIRERQ